MNSMTNTHKLLTAAAICLAAPGLGSCVGRYTHAALSDNCGAWTMTGGARLYIEDVSTSEDLYEDGSSFVADEITARFVYEGKSRMIKIHNYNPAHVGCFRKGQCYLLPTPKKLDALNANSVILIDEILQPCPIEIKKQNKS